MSKGQKRRAARPGTARSARTSGPRKPMSVSPWVSLLAQARAAASRSQWDAAVPLYERVVRERPDQLEALEALGVAALRRKQPAQALAWLSRAKRGAPQSARLLALLGRAQRSAGLLSEAIETYRKALALDAAQVALWLDLASSELEAGELPAALSSALRATELERGLAAGWQLASRILGAAGRVGEALAAARQALARNPWSAESHLLEAELLERSGAASAALLAWHAAALLPEGNSQARTAIERLSNLLGGADSELALLRARLDGVHGAGLELARWLAAHERPATAVAFLQAELSLTPDLELLAELATLLWQLGQRDRAERCLLRALELAPGDVATYQRLGAWLALESDFPGATPADQARWQRLLGECPDDVVALVNLGAAAQRSGRPSDAVPLLRRAVRLAPQQIEPYINLAAALCDLGAPQEANAAHRQALALDPARWAVQSNLLLNAHFTAHQNPEALLAEHQSYARALSEWLGPVQALHDHDADPERRLRIGYVSPDFHEHPIAHFLEPVLREHDRRRFEIHCYSDVAHPDAITRELRKHAAVYQECAGETDEALAARIRADRIDVLVDLCGHGLGNRLPVFARKPSPVQASWLGYFDTTGLAQIDYRIADEHSVPPGAERFWVERILRLPRSANCFQPRFSPDPAPPPCASRSFITFGCFSNPTKISRDAAAIFGRVLRGVPKSRLILKYHTCTDPGIVARFVRWFAEEGIGRDRIEFQGHAPFDRYLRAFAEIDIALDPFPYSGETTALHTLWMGVPVVALEGKTLAERLASRVLRVAGLQDWVAHTREDYVSIALGLAERSSELATTRCNLRARLLASPLLDHAGVTRDLEAAYREMWRTWCATLRPREPAALALHAP
jgi:protein O-GlcNAc transferase